MNILDESWRRVTRGQVRKDEFIDLVCRYSDSTRRYHSLEHIREMLHALQTTPQNESVALHRAIWWHDAVYDTTRSDNEERSATLAVQTLAEWEVADPEIERVRALIEVTKHHNAPPDDAEAAILIDLDLSILSAGRAKYDLYSEHVREEYGWVSAEAYAQGRSDFLRSMLARERIYMTLGCEAEALARSNLTRELAHWEHS
jgi:predicted metal-dependent HD superfamily phosphohydrolase